MADWRDIAARLLRAYAAVLFCNSPRVGAWFALATLASPRAALAGAFTLAASALWGRLLSLSPMGDAHLVNGLLCGLFLGAFHLADASLFGWLVVAALAVTLLAAWLGALCWQAGRLPLLSLPFVLAVWLMIFMIPSAGAAALTPAALSDWAGVLTSSGAGTWIGGFLAALGWLLLVPYPLAGAMLFAGLLVVSRYLALLALAGYLAGQVTLMALGRGDSSLLGFNFMLTAMALGGIFAIPGRHAAVVAVLGAVVSGLLTIALGRIFAAAHLPLLTLPFVLASWCLLGALGGRARNDAPTLLLDAPSLPEVSYEAARLAGVRGVAGADAAVLALPFYGEWRVTQGFDGAYTHRADWRHALDFEVFESAVPHAGNGRAREDYYCYGAPLLAPVAGLVVAARDDLDDMAPGEADLANNWGNHLLLRTATGAHVLLAHLRRGSLTVRHGAWVAAGQSVAACGSSGRAPVPHLHLHVQAGDRLGAPTQPFALANVLVRCNGGAREFRLVHVPQDGEELSSAAPDERLQAAFCLPAGLCWRYRLGDGSEATLCSELTLLGQTRLKTARGASFACIGNASAFGCYDRRGPDDALADLWLLALGMTPLCAAADTWSDRPSLALMPLSPPQRLIAHLLRPLGGACASRYRRVWDEEMNAWRQEGEHRFSLLPGLEWAANTCAWIVPGHCVRRLEIVCGSRSLSAEFVSVVATAESSITA